MKLGNPKHVVVLSFVAIGALAFVFSRLIPHGPPAAKAAPGELLANLGHSSTVTGLPVEVRRDAFSHPALLKKYLETLSPDKLPPGPKLPSAFHPLVGRLDRDSKLWLEAVETPSPGSKKPSESAGTSRQLDGKPKSKIALRAILRTAKPLALVTIDGHEDVTVGLGEYIDANYRITQFSQNAVLLVSDVDKTWLYVGSEVTER